MVKHIRRILFVGLVTAATAVAMSAGGTLADAATPRSPAHSSTAAAAPVAVTADRPAAVPLGAPQGCPSGDFCVYRNGGGSGFCTGTAGNAPFGDGCANVDGAVFNNGIAVYNDVISMNWGSNYTGSWTCIAHGNYWLYTSHYIFNHPGQGEGQNLQDNVASWHWQHNNCGNSGG